MNDQQLSHLAVLTALNNMMRGPHFSISTVDTAIKTLATVPDARAYAILRPLHCVDWSAMPPELRDAVPQLIERCINVPAHQFQLTHTTPEGQQRVLAGTLRLLTR
jgi:hypothetical protein